MHTDEQMEHLVAAIDHSMDGAAAGARAAMSRCTFLTRGREVFIEIVTIDAYAS